MALAAVHAMGSGYSAQLRRKILHDSGASISPGRLHDILTTFEEAGWLESERQRSIKARGNPNVRVYKLTEEGSAMFTNAKTARRRIGLIRG